MTGTLMKGCNVCLHDTSHYEFSKFEDPPKVLMMVLNRFSFTLSAKNNKTAVTIDRKLKLDSNIYDLIACIEHHGETASSGHYTAKLLYPDVAFSCDDYYVSTIKQLKDEISRNAYLLFYMRNN